MILFYLKKDLKNEKDEVTKKAGSIFAVIDGRVHDERQMNSWIEDSTFPADDIGKFIIGWIEKDGERIAYNLDKFELLQRFEDRTKFSPLDCRIDIESGIITEVAKREPRSARTENQGRIILSRTPPQQTKSKLKFSQDKMIKDDVPGIKQNGDKVKEL